MKKAYDSKFDDEAIAPLVKVEDTYYLELFHGATIAFKRYGTFYPATSDDNICKEESGEE